jgi:pilus assembly protein CpaC
MKTKHRTWLVAVSLALSAATVAPADAASTASPEAKSSAVGLEAGTGRVFRIKGKASSLFAADPKVVEVRPASSDSIFIFGVGPGRSTVAAIDEDGNPLAQFDVVVRPSSFAADEAATLDRHVNPAGGAKYSSTPDGVALTGKAASPAEAEQAASIAADSVPDKQTVDDQMTVSSAVQVTLRVRIAEISRTITRQFGINWTAMANFGRWGIAGSLTDGLSQSTNPPNTLGLSHVYSNGTTSIDTVLDLLAQDQLITMLAEPNLTARSGETASFLAGGEFPIPIAGQNGQITVAFKQYGVSLAFVPTVLTNGRISLHVHPEVSELTTVGAVSVPISTSLLGSATVTIPAITVRRADTTVELGSGQSFAIAGLLSADNSMNARGLPGIGEMPVIGALFKSDLFQRDESELVIVITPYLVKPVSRSASLRVPTDGFVPAGDVDRVVKMRQRAQPTIVAPSAAALAPASAQGQINLPAGAGFTLH